MKKFYFLLIFLFLTIIRTSIAQNELAGFVLYKQILNLNPHAPEDEDGINACLFFRGNSTKYVYDRIDSTIGDTVRILRKELMGMTRFYQRDSIGKQIFIDFSNKQVIQRDVGYGHAYIIEESLPIFNWIISTEQKKIGDIPCQKAATRHRGRNYEVWFAPSIPINGGPWKFYGLPGLILEAGDETGEVKFRFKKIINSSVSEKLVDKPTGERKVTRKELEKIYDEEYDKKEKKFFSTMPKGTTVISTGTIHPKPIEYDE